MSELIDLNIGDVVFGPSCQLQVRCRGKGREDRATPLRGASAKALARQLPERAGAQASVRLYPLVRCAKANRLKPYAYLRRVFTELPRAQSLGDIEALLPTRLTPADLN